MSDHVHAATRGVGRVTLTLSSRAEARDLSNGDEITLTELRDKHFDWEVPHPPEADSE